MSGEVERRGTPVPAKASGPGRRNSRSDTGSHASGQAGSLSPEWVWVGVDVPAGKRLYASKDLKGSAFAVAVDQHMNADGWHLETVMQNMLVITKPTYPECLAELMRIWANWEANERGLPAASKPAGRALP